MELNEAFIAFLTPIVLAVLQLLKWTTALGGKPKILPFLAVVAGIVLAAARSLWQPPADLAALQVLGYALIHGLLAGLASQGLYKTAKNLLGPLLQRLGLLKPEEPSA